MTVLVLNLKAPSVAGRGQLWAALHAESALWYSVVLTFVITSIFWMLQHQVFDAVEAMTSQTMRLTILTLGFVTVLPFTTSMLGQAKGDPLAFQLYFANMSAIALCMALKLEVARVQGDLHVGLAADRTRQRTWSLSLIMLTAAISSRYVQPQNVWILPVGVGMISRLVRKWLAARAATRAVAQSRPTEAA